MRNTTEETNKKVYFKPNIEQVKLDNDISLALESDPPYGPGETMNTSPDYLKNDPFKTNQA